MNYDVEAGSHDHGVPVWARQPYQLDTGGDVESGGGYTCAVQGVCEKYGDCTSSRIWTLI